MSRLMKKLRGKRGETLVETLVAILICVLSLTMMFTATAVAANLNSRAAEGDRQYATDMATAELRTAALPEGTVTILAEGQTPANIPVRFYGSTGSAYTSYAVLDAEGSG